MISLNIINTFMFLLRAHVDGERLAYHHNVTHSIVVTLTSHICTHGLDVVPRQDLVQSDSHSLNSEEAAGTGVAWAAA
jgi:hypothetical protein